jgi:hypothetical protein
MAQNKAPCRSLFSLPFPGKPQKLEGASPNMRRDALRDVLLDAGADIGLEESDISVRKRSRKGCKFLVFPSISATPFFPMSTQFSPLLPTKRSGARRFWRALGLYLLAALLLLGAFYLEENWRGARAWAAYQRNLKAKGEALDWRSFIPPFIPDERNFAMAPLFVRELRYQPDPKTRTYTFGPAVAFPDDLKDMPSHYSSIFSEFSMIPRQPSRRIAAEHRVFSRFYAGKLESTTVVLRRSEAAGPSALRLAVDQTRGLHRPAALLPAKRRLSPR